MAKTVYGEMHEVSLCMTLQYKCEKRAQVPGASFLLLPMMYEKALSKYTLCYFRAYFILDKGIEKCRLVKSDGMSSCF